MNKALIIGCGYTGVQLGVRLQQIGFHVTGTTRSQKRSAELRDSGIEPISGSLQYDDTVDMIRAADPSLVAYFVPPQNAEQDRLAAILEAFADLQLEAFLYASSSSVYGDRSGDWVDESTPVTAGDADSAARLEAEHLVADAVSTHRLPTRVCRITGIYGPGRTLKQPLQSGAYTLIKGHDPWVSRIHIDDLVTSLIAAWQSGSDGRTYNLVDQSPHRASEFANLAADLNGVPRPRRIDESEARNRYDQQTLQRKLANKRVRCARLIDELKVQLKYPTYKDGLPAAVAAERHSLD